MTERQKYQVLQKFDDFELRLYDACVVAEVNINNDYAAATSAAFRPLFNYISKGNAASQSIAMTAPVIATTDTNLDTDLWKVHFVMPAGSNLKDMPLPKDSNIELHQLPAQTCAASAFRGRANKRLSEKEEKRLRLSAQKNNISLSQETRICRFDPPFKPGILQYNEIVIPIS